MKKNLERLVRLMKRAEQGEHLVIGFLGGSITQGSLSSSPYTCYAYLVYKWWKRAFPQAVFSYVNAGIGGTSSHYGAARVWKDLLCYQPDFVVIDFSVNDEANTFYEETYEGTVRRLLSASCDPAVVVLNNVCYDTGINAQEYHNRVAAHYKVPCVSIRDTVYRRIERGEIRREDITPDNLHPNDAGHRLAADEICRLLELAKQEMEQGSKESGNGSDAVINGALEALPVPLTANAYENSRLIQIQDNAAQLNGFCADSAEKKGMLDIFKNGWTAARTNDKIVFEIECSCLAVQYRKSIVHPAPAAKAVIDGDEAHAAVLDGNFEETWGDCLYLQPLLHHAKRCLHRIEITITDAADIAVPFYLVSLIVS